MDEILGQPLREIAKAIATNQVSAKQVTKAYLDKIESVNPALNAIVRLEPETAMKYADRCDLALKGGESPGKLFGVPMTIKDSLDTYDMVTTWGTSGRKDFRPGRDATCVERVRNEGAVLMGKTNTPEFTLSFTTDNTIFGKTNNPFNLNRTPGGSSGGAAAIIAAGGSPFDIGTDTAGSIRLPCHFCGVAGIKPTTGRVPCTGNSLPVAGLLAPLTQPGPMARYVDDLILLMEVISGPDNIDPHAIPVPWMDPYNINVEQLRFGYHTDNGIKTPDASIVAAVNGVIQHLSDAHIAVVEVRPTGLEMTGFLFGQLFSADNGDMVNALLEDSHTDQPSPTVLELIENTNNGANASDIAQIINLWHNYQSSMLSYFDDFDILLTPVNAHTATTHDQETDFSAYTYTAAYNLTGWPSVVIRADTDPNGLPIGIQVLARPFREDQCLAVASWLEAKIGTFAAPLVDSPLPQDH